jgi:2-C-methyl-D-erythritol 2,4-cyclodiphosphate synthase
MAGVRIPSDFGCVAHSDGDCMLHALMDALLGAAALPNVGELFPDDDPANAGRSSVEMLEVVLGHVRRRGFRVSNVDFVIQLERPKIAPLMEILRGKIAGLLGIVGEDVGVKATTAEGLGAVGRGEAVEIFCLCLLEKKGENTDGRVT